MRRCIEEGVTVVSDISKWELPTTIDGSCYYDRNRGRGEASLWLKPLVTAFRLIILFITKLQKWL